MGSADESVGEQLAHERDRAGSRGLSRVRSWAGEFIRFDGNRCWHYTTANDTGATRVSFDFRVVPIELFDNEHQGPSKAIHRGNGKSAPPPTSNPCAWESITSTAESTSETNERDASRIARGGMILVSVRGRPRRARGAEYSIGSTRDDGARVSSVRAVPSQGNRPPFPSFTAPSRRTP